MVREYNTKARGCHLTRSLYKTITGIKITSITVHFHNFHSTTMLNMGNTKEVSNYKHFDFQLHHFDSHV